MEKEKYDVVILGAGPAGLTAGIYAARYGLKTAVIAREIGGMANMAHKIENYPSFSGSGKELMEKFHKQAVEHGARFLNEDVIGISKEKDNFIITTNSKKFLNVRSIIISLGSEKRRLNVPGEDNFLGKGVSYCATCDAFFFKNKNVAVIGGGDSACKAAVLLSGLAKKVYLVHRGEQEKCEAYYKKQLKDKKNVEIIMHSTPMQIKGSDSVKELIIETGGKEMPTEKKLEVNGVFIEAGSLPVSDIAKMLKIKIDENNFIIADPEMKTNVPGIFAAGDVVKSKLKQIIIAASQGAMAAKSCYDYLENK